MADIIQIRRDTAANWASVNPVLAQGEMGLETDTEKMKLGDGGSNWNSLNYFITTQGSVAITGGTIDGTVIGGTTPAAFTSTGIDDNAVSNALTIDSSSRMTASSGAAFVKNTTTTSTSKTLVNGEQCFVDTSTQTVTLPASPSIGDSVTVTVGDFIDTVIARNGSNIMGLAEDLTVDAAFLSLNLVYVNATNGWTIV